MPLKTFMTKIILNASITKQGFGNIHEQVLAQKIQYTRLIVQRVKFKNIYVQAGDNLMKELARLELHSIDSQMKGVKKAIFRKEQQLKILLG